MLDRAGLSAFVGSCSIGFWLLVQAVQIHENYVLKSGEGLSVLFIFIWLLGDLSNLIGAALQGLLPTVTYLALYYVFCDFVLLGQVAYYRRFRVQHPEMYPALHDHDERTALLAQEAKEHLHDKPPWYKDAVVCFFSLLFVLVVGVAGWKMSTRHGPRGPLEEVWDDVAQVIGWTSAVLYLSSRFPQLIKNTKTKCEGLSLLFFFFALMGNLTFCAQIFIVSIEPRHLMINLSWLVGAGGTVITDLIVLGQFAYYARDRAEARRIAELEDA